MIVFLSGLWYWDFLLLYCTLAELAFFCAQGGLKLRLIKLNWQKSMCARVKATDEQAKADVKVCKN